jgi:hypothetical protein
LAATADKTQENRFVLRYLRPSPSRKPSGKPTTRRRIIIRVRPIQGNPAMHHSRLCAVLIDCKVSNLDEAAGFWGAALGRPVDLKHPSSRGNYRMLETLADEPIVEIQRVDHESRIHIDIETDDIPAEVARLEKLGAKVTARLERWVVMQAPTGQRFCVVRLQRPGFPKNANRWD